MSATNRPQVLLQLPSLSRTPSNIQYVYFFLASLGPQVLLLLFRLAGTVGPQVLLLLPRIYGTLGKIYTSSLPLWDPRSFYYFLDSPGPQVIYTSSLPLWDLWTIGYRPFISS